ncbi:MAG: hypothetical protein HQK89_12980 [Nitrospirae bacterium]|nr:hypothetical protein [Nitrospirota bacterium]
MLPAQQDAQRVQEDSVLEPLLGVWLTVPLPLPVVHTSTVQWASASGAIKTRNTIDSSRLARAGSFLTPGKDLKKSSLKIYFLFVNIFNSFSTVNLSIKTSSLFP